MIGEPWLGREPRAWQREALPVALEGLRSRRPRVIQACTGAGKSIAQAEVVAEILASPRLTAADVVVVTVPTEALVDQLAATLALRLPGIVGRWYGRRHETAGVRVYVTCVPSLGSLAAYLSASGSRCVAWLADECHRGLASEDRQRWISDLAPLTRIGWTATPWRTETPIPGWEAPLAYRYGLADAVRDGVCLLPTVRYYSGPEADVTDATIAMLREVDPEGPGVVSALSIVDAENTADALSDAGWASLPIHSRLPRAEIEARLEALRAGELRALVHVRLLVEGVDLPWLRWIALRAPRTTLGLVQEVGRVIRVAEGKTSAIVLDPLAQSPIEAFSTPEALGELEQLAAEEAAPDDRDPDDEGPPVTVIPRAVALVELDRWIASLVAMGYAAGLRPRAIRSSRDWRSQPPTDVQRERLASLADRPRGPISLLPAHVRAGVRELAANPDPLSRGGASDLLSILFAASAARSASVAGQDPPDWSRAWRWPDAILVSPLEVATVRAARGVEVIHVDA